MVTEGKNKKINLLAHIKLKQLVHNNYDRNSFIKGFVEGALYKDLEIERFKNYFKELKDNRDKTIIDKLINKL